MAAVAIALGLVVAGIQYWSESYAPGWSTPAQRLYPYASFDLPDNLVPCAVGIGCPNGTMQRNYPAEDHPGHLTRPPGLGDIEFAAVVALPAYFLFVGFILSIRAIRGATPAEALNGDAVAVLPPDRPQDRIIATAASGPPLAPPLSEPAASVREPEPSV